MKAKKSRPVTVIGILLVLLSLYLFISSIVYFRARSSIACELELLELLEEEGRDNIAVDQIKRELRSSATIDIINSLFFMVVGVGILKRRNWARILLIFGCVSLFLLWTVGLRSDSVYFNIFRILVITLYISVVVFFTRSKVKDEFKLSPTVEVATPVQDEPNNK